MELLADFIGNGAMIGDTSLFHGSLMMKSEEINHNNNNIMNSITLNCNPSNGALINANTFKSPVMSSTTSFIGTDLNSTAMNNSTFMHGSTTLNSSTMADISFVSAMFNSNTLSSAAVNNNTSFTGSVSSAIELNNWTAANGQLPVVVAKGTVFPRMPSELNETPLSPVSYHPASELKVASPSSTSISPIPLGNSMKGKRKSAPAEVTRRSTPLKPPKKYRGGGPEEDREIKRCKRSLSFIAEGGTDGGGVGGEVSSVDYDSSSETSEEKSPAAEKTATTTNQRPKASVERRNKRERMRVKQINNTFVTLRNQLPSDVCSAKRNAKKFSKVDTLRMAIDYIRGLRQLITDHDAMFMSAECLALLASSSSSSSSSSSPPPQAEGVHLLQHAASSSAYQHIHGGFMRENSADSAGGSDRSGAESVESSSTTDPLHGPPSTSTSTSSFSSSSSYPSSTSSLSASSSSSVGIVDFFPPSLASNLSEDLFDAFLADMYMTS